mmetsp:Transcript_96696/g.282661  ORF Transcript_96696/g.282661 Transcript_96696/m.282661 type:complete len:120 (-) Transcript_96696:74-433(-)
MALGRRHGPLLLTLAILQVLPPHAQARELSDAGRAQEGRGLASGEAPADATVLVQSRTTREKASFVHKAAVGLNYPDRPTSYVVSGWQIARQFGWCIYWIPIVIFITFPFLLIAHYFWK